MRSEQGRFCYTQLVRSKDCARYDDSADSLLQYHEFQKMYESIFVALHVDKLDREELALEWEKCKDALLRDWERDSNGDGDIDENEVSL